MDVKTVKVILWGTPIGYLHQMDSGLIGFQYDDQFVTSGIEVSPLQMPLSGVTYSFPSLSEETFKGLPGLMADSLPDKFGNIVIQKYLDSLGRGEDSLSVIERLCYTGKRGMGALEYQPNVDIGHAFEKINIDALTKLASDILSEKESLHIKHDEHMIAQLMQSGSSVGGARAKTLIAWNPETNDIRSGQINAGPGYEYWLLKFDDVKNNKDKDLEPDSGEYTKIEYAYYLMARAAGIDMSECRLYKEKGKSHFMTKRFDRIGKKGEKLHMQSLCAIAHMDFNTPRVFSYEDAFRVMRHLQLPLKDYLQLFKRMIFNEYAKNFDDHTKNLAFLMNKKGTWSLAPAFDMTFSYRKDSLWVSEHQMLINGKSREIAKDDFLKVAELAGIKKNDALVCEEQVHDAVSKWVSFANEAELSRRKTDIIRKQIKR
ncbi:MAG: type II toxin-antitoxin system HipA family toxin [Clostridia bacterium]|nr:type II toxin-antitoxin system HipA family toxin [Clostridia bacterium]